MKSRDKEFTFQVMSQCSGVFDNLGGKESNHAKFKMTRLIGFCSEEVKVALNKQRGESDEVGVKIQIEI